MSQESPSSETRDAIIGCTILAVLFLSYVGAIIWIGSRAGWGWTAAILLITAAIWFAARRIHHHRQLSLASPPRGGLEAALRALLAGIESNPEALAGLEAIIRQLEKDPVLRAILALIETQSPEDVLSVMQTHPILLTDEGDEALLRFIESARQMNETKMVRLVEDRYRLLWQLRESDVDPELLE